jgi:DnaJ-class molecular chaperone
VVIDHYGCPVPRSIIKEKGDLFLIIRISVPGNITEEQRSIFTKLLELEKNHGEEQSSKDGEAAQEGNKESSISQGDEVFASA